MGIVGAGGVARRHAGALAAMPDVTLVGVTDPDRERAADLADTAWVCVPPFAHGEVEERLAAAGVALFVEKPLGLDVATAERVQDAVDAAGVPTSVGHHWRSSTASGAMLLAYPPGPGPASRWPDPIGDRRHV